jgi:hypothetical protein
MLRRSAIPFSTRSSRLALRQTRHSVVLRHAAPNARSRLLSHLTIDEASNEPGIDLFTSVAVVDAVVLDHRRLLV